MQWLEILLIIKNSRDHWKSMVKGEERRIRRSYVVSRDSDQNSSQKGAIS